MDIYYDYFDQISKENEFERQLQLRNVGDEKHPLLIRIILENVFTNLSVEDLKTSRFVCTLWNQEILYKMTNNSKKSKLKNLEKTFKTKSYWHLNDFIQTYKNYPNNIPYSSFLFSERELAVTPSNIQIMYSKAFRNFFKLFHKSIVCLHIAFPIESSELKVILKETGPTLKSLTIGNGFYHGSESEHFELDLPQLHYLHLNLMSVNDAWIIRSILEKNDGKIRTILLQVNNYNSTAILNGATSILEEFKVPQVLEVLCVVSIPRNSNFLPDWPKLQLQLKQFGFIIGYPGSDEPEFLKIMKFLETQKKSLEGLLIISPCNLYITRPNPAVVETPYRLPKFEKLNLLQIVLDICVPWAPFDSDVFANLVDLQMTVVRGDMNILDAHFPLRSGPAADSVKSVWPKVKKLKITTGVKMTGTVWDRLHLYFPSVEKFALENNSKSEHNLKLKWENTLKEFNLEDMGSIAELDFSTVFKFHREKLEKLKFMKKVDRTGLKNAQIEDEKFGHLLSLIEKGEECNLAIQFRGILFSDRFLKKFRRIHPKVDYIF